MPQRTFEGFGGLSLAADIYGQEDDPCVLLIPSAGQSRETWRAAAESLAATGRYVVSVDLRGHGGSARPEDGRYDLDAYVGDLSAILAQLSSRPVIVGASLGGWIAMTVLGEGGPDLASGLVLVDSPPHMEPDKARQVGASLRRYAETSADIGFDPRSVAGMNLPAVEERLAKAAVALKLPTLVIRGANSELSTRESVQELTASIADAEAVEIENAGHLVAIDQADAFNAVLLEFLERRIPRDPPEYQAGSDSRTLRDALGCFATGVTVVTAVDDAGTPVGLTANSFTSVSLDPELLLVCLAKTASSLSVFEETEYFAVNVLHIGQQPVSNRFAMKGEDRFAETDCETWSTGVPIIKRSLASFECRKYAMHDGGDHVILIGKVDRVRFEPRRDPLLYFRGKYRRLHFA